MKLTKDVFRISKELSLELVHRNNTHRFLKPHFEGGGLNQKRYREAILELSGRLKLMHCFNSVNKKEVKIICLLINEVAFIDMNHFATWHTDLYWRLRSFRWMLKRMFYEAGDTEFSFVLDELPEKPLFFTKPEEEWGFTRCYKDIKLMKRYSNWIKKLPI